MVVEVNPKDTSRAYAFQMWMKAPNPMVTLFRTIDVTRLVKISKRKKLKFNMLMCYCIGRYRRKFFRYNLPVSFQFHHTQMDGEQAGEFLENLRNTINGCYK